MDLRAAVEKYLEVAGSFGKPMPLDRLGLTQKEIEAMLSAWEDDYHLNRHFELIPASGMPADAPAYRVNGTLQTAIVFRETIRDVLG
jgi:hypothetical protein